jgi:hypothetical protein
MRRRIGRRRRPEAVLQRDFAVDETPDCARSMLADEQSGSGHKVPGGVGERA